MLNVLRFAGVFKKLQINDLTKYLIGRLTAAERTALDNTSHQQLQPRNQTRDSHSVQQQQSPQSVPVVRQHFYHLGTKSASAALAGGGSGLAFGNGSTLTTDLTTSARVSASASVNAQQQQQTVARELEENSEVSDCDQVMENMSTAAKHQESQAEAIKAAAAAATPSSSSASSSETCPGASSPADLIKFLELVGSLKHIKRTGWVLRDVKDCESISGHMYRMGMMTYLLDGRNGLDRTKCLELAMVHDLAECVVGDITPFCGVSREDKKMRELQAMEDICKLIQPYGKKVLELFEEYENAQTPESKFVKDLDRLDLVLQAFEYEKRDNCVMKHQEFFDSTDGKFEHPFVQQLVDEIYAQRRVLAGEREANMPASNDATTNGFTNGHHANNDITTSTNGDANRHDEHVSGAKKASTS